jgi:acetoin utilization deacetylase AcuC-like enzyme
MHGRHNYPFHKEKSDLDIALEDGTTDTNYLSLLQEHLPQLIETVAPSIAFYLSGVDILATDQFGKLCPARQNRIYPAASKQYTLRGGHGRRLFGKH